MRRIIAPEDKAGRRTTSDRGPTQQFIAAFGHFQPSAFQGVALGHGQQSLDRAVEVLVDHPTRLLGIAIAQGDDNAAMILGEDFRRGQAHAAQLARAVRKLATQRPDLFDRRDDGGVAGGVSHGKVEVML